MSLPPKLAEIISEIESLDDRDLRAEVLVDFAKRFVDVPAEVAQRPFSETHRVPACQSEAFVWISKDDAGGITPYFAVENPQGISAKSFAVILQEGLTGCSAQSIKAVDDGIVTRLFGSSLSMGKGEGLMGMIRMLRTLVAQGA